MPVEKKTAEDEPKTPPYRTEIIEKPPGGLWPSFIARITTLEGTRLVRVGRLSELLN